jgi:uncharacterized DUF497 family protein
MVIQRPIIRTLEIEFDTSKDAANIAKHGVSLEEAALLFEGDFLTRLDGRKEYGGIA